MRSESRNPKKQLADVQAEVLAGLDRMVHAPAGEMETLCQAAAHPSLNEELAQTLLKRREIDHTVLEALGRNARAMKTRKVRMAVVIHPRTPRHISLPQLRHLFTFDLMQVSLTPQVPSDLKMAADEVLVTRMQSISSGERLSLAKRGSGRVAAELLLDPEESIVEAALNNGRLTEAFLVKIIGSSGSSKALAEMVCRHEKWALQREVRGALLRHGGAPLSYAIAFTDSFTTRDLEDIFQRSDMADNIKFYLMRIAERRRKGKESVEPA